MRIRCTNKGVRHHATLGVYNDASGDLFYHTNYEQFPWLEADFSSGRGLVEVPPERMKGHQQRQQFKAEREAREAREKDARGGRR